MFEAIVTGLRDRGTCLQAKLSPIDTEMGLALDVDLADLAGVPDRRPAGTDESVEAPDGDEESSAAGDVAADGRSSAGFGIIHPGLGATITELRENVRVGTHVFVEVDTSALHAYPVDEARQID